jgi:putative membrane protein
VVESSPSLLGPWSLEPLQVLPTALAAFLYLWRTRTLARSGRPVSGWRQASFWAGIGVVVLALNSPIDALGEEHFFFLHMTQHVLIGDVAPLLFMLGLNGQILRPVLALRPVERLRVLAHPLVALPVWAFNLYVWHLPYLYDAALHHDSIHALEHFLFFTCGCLMWEPVVETLPAPEWFGTGWKLGYIAAVRVTETILGNVFIWSGSAFYSVYRHAPEWGLTPTHDQNLGGVVMMAEGSLVTLAALAWLFLKLAAEGETRQQLLEQGYDPRQVRRAVRYGRADELRRSVPPRSGASAYRSGRASDSRV